MRFEFSSSTTTALSGMHSRSSSVRTGSRSSAPPAAASKRSKPSARIPPDIVLMDLQMPGLSGSETALRLREVAPASRVLMLTISGVDEDVLEAMLAGASGYLVKGTPPEALVAAIRAVAAGAALLSPGIATKLLGRIRVDAAAPPRPGPAILSERELEVLELIARGKPNAEIARTLYLSPNTVRNHISNILSKLQISNRTEATAYAIRSGLV